LVQLRIAPQNPKTPEGDFYKLFKMLFDGR